MSNKIVLDSDKVESKKLYYLFKRIFDIIASAGGLILLSPVMAGIAIKIKAEDGGSIIYRQKRIGKNGKSFEMYKFRSMVENADHLFEKIKDKNNVDGAMFKMKNDPRITKTGKFLRKHSLDELPQLFNVLKGDMSLVGPRPPLPSETKQYTKYDKQRLLVVPGCTGLWQATVRNEVGFNDMVQLDLKYIKKASFMFDLSILLKTIKIIFKPNGAY